METIRIDLNTGTADALPQGVTLVPVYAEESMSPVMLHIQDDLRSDWHILLSMMYCDGNGTLSQASVGIRDCGQHGGNCRYEWLELDDYPYDHIWIRPNYTHTWAAEEPVVINVR